MIDAGIGRRSALCDHPTMPHARRTRRAAPVALALGAALGMAGCSGISSLPGHPHHRASGQDGPAAPAAEVAVVRHWADALRAGHVRAAAGYFRLPSVFDNGPQETLTIRTAAQAEFVNSSLPCGAEVLSAFRTGHFIDVLFRLTLRAGPGGGHNGCAAEVGLSARTDFLIRDGKIVAWVRAPSLPGDPGLSPRRSHGRSGKTSPGTTTPGTTTGGGSPVRDLLDRGGAQKPSRT